MIKYFKTFELRVVVVTVVDNNKHQSSHSIAAKNKYLKSIVDFQVERYDKLVELYEEIEGDNKPGFQELSGIMGPLAVTISFRDSAKKKQQV